MFFSGFSPLIYAKRGHEYILLLIFSTFFSHLLNFRQANKIPRKRGNATHRNAERQSNYVCILEFLIRREETNKNEVSRILTISQILYLIYLHNCSLFTAVHFVVISIYIPNHRSFVCVIVNLI